MFSFIVATLQVAMIITVFITLPTLFILRLVVIIKNKLTFKDKVLVLLLPFSIGYYLLVSKEKQLKLYNILMVIFLILAIAGILFTLYQRFINGY